MSDERNAVGVSLEGRALAGWLRGRVEAWRRQEELIKRQQGGRVRESDEALELLRGYRGVARDLSLARRLLPGSRVIRYLEALLLRAFDTIQRPPLSSWAQIRQLFSRDLPREIHALRGAIAVSAALFLLGIAAGWGLVSLQPELIALFASEAMIETVQNGELWTDDLLNIVPSSVLSLQIMTNNIMVTFFAFALGAFYGIGTLYIMLLNGLLLGAVFAFTGQHELDGRLFEFVIAHGMVELSVIVIAGAAGMRLGEALLRPGLMTRTEAFRVAVSRAGVLVAAGAPLLVGAGLIEGYISPDPNFDLNFRLLVGLSYWLFMLLLFSGRLQSRRRSAS